MKHRAVFLDRDGVINRDRLDFVKSWEEFEFLPGAIETLSILAKTPYKIVVISNQSGLGRGLFSQATLDEIHAKMTAQIIANGGRIDGVFYCPHAPDEGCDCRKPAPGLFVAAARDLEIDLASSWAIGDRYRDVEAANLAGVPAILLDRNSPDPSDTLESQRGFVRASELLDAIRIVLGQGRTSVRAKPGSTN